MGGDEGPMAGADPAVPRVTIPPELLKAIGREAAEAFDQWNVGRVRSAAAEAAVEVARAKIVVDSVAMPPSRKDMVASLTPFVLQEWGADEHCSPTAALGALVGITLLTTQRAIQVFREEAAERKAAAGSVAPPSPLAAP